MKDERGYQYDYTKIQGYSVTHMCYLLAGIKLKICVGAGFEKSLTLEAALQ